MIYELSVWFKLIEQPWN